MFVSRNQHKVEGNIPSTHNSPEKDKQVDDLKLDDNTNIIRFDSENVI